MKFLGILLISVLPLTLSEQPALSSLPFFSFFDTAFDGIDQNQNDILELTECISSFHAFKKNPTDSSIGREWFAEFMLRQNVSDALANHFFANFDLDKDRDLDDLDFNAICTFMNKNSDAQVTREEFIRYGDEILNRFQE
ncbi:unnamed protein product [Lymnaea stagnalis]|uniref:EF-hand domain-containing protein n=1 Tax=Lymnaea stagnalis TaxID=6523 RepID=A0AAV2HZG4_LYMST